MIKFVHFLFLLFFLFTTFTRAQLHQINGIVYDSQTYEPLPFANILIEGTTTGSVTDSKGNFSINIKKYPKNIIVSYVGYQSQILGIDEIYRNKVIRIGLQSINIGLQEVTVYSSKSTNSDMIQSSNLTIQSDRIREIAVGMPDILRSVQALPGITANNAFKADFNVRGGNQDENLVLVNGTQVYEPFHIKEASNASVGIFNVDLIRKVNLITGGFSAKYGDKMSSVLDIEYREGRRDNYSGAFSVSLAYFDGYAEGPLTSKGSFIIGARKSYMEYIMSMIDYEDISRAKPSFYDVQGVFSFDLTSRNRILFEFIHAYDDFSYDPKRTYSTKIENENNEASYNSTLLTLKSKNIISSKALLNAEINYYDQGDNEYRLFEREYTSIDRFVERLTFDTLKITTLEVNSELHYQLNTDYEIQAGISYKNIEYEQTSDDLWKIDDGASYQGDYGSSAIDANSSKFSSYLENIFSISDRLRLNIGGRTDYFEINNDLTVSPRFNASYKLTDRSSIRAAWGNFYQSPTYDQLLYSESSDSNTQSQKATHYILGFDQTFWLTENKNNFLNFKLEGFYKEYKDLISSYYGVFERITYSKLNDSEGSASGIDLHMVLNLQGFYAWISYGYLNAVENLKNDDQNEYPRYTDQRHTISFVSNIDLGNDWNLSLKGYYGSGFPYTPKTAVKNEDNIWIWQTGKKHSENLPAYKRIDVRISKLFHFSKFNIAAFIDVSNIFNFKNIQQYEYSSIPDIYKPEPEEILLWPILPTFGVRFEF